MFPYGGQPTSDIPPKEKLLALAELANRALNGCS